MVEHTSPERQEHDAIAKAGVRDVKTIAGNGRLQELKELRAKYCAAKLNTLESEISQGDFKNLRIVGLAAMHSATVKRQAAEAAPAIQTSSADQLDTVPEPNAAAKRPSGGDKRHLLLPRLLLTSLYQFEALQDKKPKLSLMSLTSSTL